MKVVESINETTDIVPGIVEFWELDPSSVASVMAFAI
jgi:hypothetical protein